MLRRDFRKKLDLDIAELRLDDRPRVTRTHSLTSGWSSTSGLADSRHSDCHEQTHYSRNSEPIAPSLLRHHRASF
jgi:hypothetical protein